MITLGRPRPDGVRVAVIGASGNFGSKIVRHLQSMPDVNLVWQGGSDSRWWEIEGVDWVICSTPHEFHFEQAKHFLKLGVNVFLEKPGTLSSEALERLFELADKNRSHLYIDDVYRFKKPERFSKVEYCYRSDNRQSNIIDLIVYHHLYLIYYQDPPGDAVEIDIDSFSALRAEFSITFDNGAKYEFSYNLDSPSKHDSLNYGAKEDALAVMLEAVLFANVDFDQNHRSALFATMISEKLKLAFFGKVLVVGGGVYGCTAAVALAKAGFSVELHERNSDLISAASWVNQYRVHLGFHYPRSEETRLECIAAAEQFSRQFGRAMVHTTKHHYAVAASDSYVSADEYLAAMDASNLDYRILSELPNTSLTLLTFEKQFNPRRLRKALEERMFGAGVQVQLGQEYRPSAPETDTKYRFRVFATYARLNDFRDPKKTLKFQLVEKIVVQLPENMKDFSLVVMDGPFFSIDPLPGTSFHVVGAVLAANHMAQEAQSPPVCPAELLVDSGQLVCAPTQTRRDDIIGLVRHFLGDVQIEYQGSFFVTKAIKSDVLTTDERKHEIEVDTANRSIYVLGGKVSASTIAAQRITEIARTEFLRPI